MFYLVKIGHELSAKNRLQKAVQSYLNSLDRTLIKDEDLNYFQLQVTSKLSELNTENNRCQPIKWYWHFPNDHYGKDPEKCKVKDLSLHVTNGFIIMDLLYTNKHFTVE